MTQTAAILDGKAIARVLRAEIHRQAQSLSAASITPRLDVIMIGSHEASAIYVRSKERACKRVGITSHIRLLADDSTTDDVLTTIAACNNDPRVHAIMLQLPLPPQLNTRVLSDAIDPNKDVDCLGTHNLGLLFSGQIGPRPCTPLAVMALLDHAGVQITGSHAAVIGRSAIVGKPLAQLLLQRDATVTVCHSATTDLGAVLRDADIIIAAAGQPRLVTADMISTGSTVIDVATSPTADGGLCGDVAFDEVSQVAGLITPVPGGVGPMTVAMLLRNVIDATIRQTHFQDIIHRT